MTNSDPQMLLLGHPRLFSRDVAQVSPSFVCLGVPLISASTYALALRVYSSQSHSIVNRLFSEPGHRSHPPLT